MKNTLDLNDLIPEEADFELTKFPGEKFTLMEFSLYVQAWATKRFGSDLKSIFENQALPEISELVHFMLKDKTEFPTFEDLQKAIVQQKDRVSVMQAVIKSVGLSQPLIDKMQMEKIEGNVESPSQPTGAQSTTSSHPNTTTP